MKTEIKRIAGTDYTKIVDTTLGIFVATGSYSYASLKAFDPPRGADGAVALLINRAAAGTLSSAASVPTGYLYVYNNTDASDENGTTILLPGLTCTLSDTFTIPTANGTTTGDMTVDSNEHVSVGDTLYVTGIGYFVVTALTGTTTITVVNNGATGNTAAGNTAASGAFVTQVPATGPRAGRWMKLSALA